MTSPATVAVVPRLSLSHVLIAAMFIGAGTLHLLRPGSFLSMVPPWLPAPMLLVLVSGVCELLGGVGVLLPATRVAAGWGLIALLVAVLPANVQMLLDARAVGASRSWQSALVVRLPLQLVLIWWVHRAAVRRPT